MACENDHSGLEFCPFFFSLLFGFDSTETEVNTYLFYYAYVSILVYYTYVNEIEYFLFDTKVMYQS